jgi:hypothetical protein
MKTEISIVEYRRTARDAISGAIEVGITWSKCGVAFLCGGRVRDNAFVRCAAAVVRQIAESGAVLADGLC